MRLLSAAIVLPVVLLGQLSQAGTEVITSTEVSCTTEPVNLFTNPSFETGNYSPWNRLTGAISVIHDDSDDGQYAAQVSGVGGPNYAMSQTVMGLKVGTTYTFSFVTTETLVASTVVLTVERTATPTAIPTISASGSPSMSTSESGSTNEQGTGHESSSDTAGSASSGAKDVAALGLMVMSQAPTTPCPQALQRAFGHRLHPESHRPGPLV